MVCIIDNTCIGLTDKTLDNLRKKLELLKRIRFLQKSLIRISFKRDERRSVVYVGLLGSLKLANKSLYEINQLVREYDNGQ